MDTLINRNASATAMKLRDARLCINCDTVYAATGLVAQCPACGSGTFSLLTRWVPTMAELDGFTARLKGTAVLAHGHVPTTKSNYKDIIADAEPAITGCVDRVTRPASLLAVVVGLAYLAYQGGRALWTI